MKIEFYDIKTGEAVACEDNYYYAVDDNGEILKYGYLEIDTADDIGWRVVEASRSE